MFEKIKKWMKGEGKLPDLSSSYMDASIPEKQRPLADEQLKLMYAGNPAPHFLVLKEVFETIGGLRAEKSKPLRLLDAGCASGYYIEVLRHLVPYEIKYTGSDFNMAMLRMANERYPGNIFGRMDLRSLAFASRSFDAVLSGAVIVHIKEWKKAVAELARVSANWLVLHRTVTQLEGETFIRMEKHYDVNVYRVFVSEKELIGLLTENGFDLISKLVCNEGDLGPSRGNFTYLFGRKPER